MGGAQLGAGLGHLSVRLARMGAHVTTTESGCTKQSAQQCGCWGCLEQLRRSVASQLGVDAHAFDQGARVAVPPAEDSGPAGSIRVAELAWGAEAYARPAAERAEADGGARVDALVMSEVVYNQAEDSLYDDEFHDNLVRPPRSV